jgi:hypothetical protein
MDNCVRCGAVARYITEDGKTWCTSCCPRDNAPVQPTGCKVFSATRSYDREHLGERVTEWIRTNNVEVVDVWVTQSSDKAYHCITHTLFFRER